VADQVAAAVVDALVAIAAAKLALTAYHLPTATAACEL